MNIQAYVESLYGDIDPVELPFTEEEIDELDETGELLVFLPGGYSMKELVDVFGFT